MTLQDLKYAKTGIELDIKQRTKYLSLENTSLNKGYFTRAVEDIQELYDILEDYDVQIEDIKEEQKLNRHKE